MYGLITVSKKAIDILEVNILVDVVAYRLFLTTKHSLAFTEIIEYIRSSFVVRSSQPQD